MMPLCPSTSTGFAKAELPDRGGDQGNLGFTVRPGIASVRNEITDRAMLEAELMLEHPVIGVSQIGAAVRHMPNSVMTPRLQIRGGDRLIRSISEAQFIVIMTFIDV